MDFSFIQLSVLKRQNKVLKEFVLCAPGAHLKAVLTGRANMWKMHCLPHALIHLSTLRCVRMYINIRALLRSIFSYYLF